MGQSETFNIRQMVELTGLSEFTIRGWESRYSAFAPARGDTGRRAYSKQDVEKALLLRELLKRGHKIGKIATLSNTKLKNLFENREQAVFSGSTQDFIIYEEVTRVLDLMALQKWSDLDLLIKKMPNRNPRKMIHQFFLPILQGLAGQVFQGRVSIAQEHILSSLLKEKIYSLLNEISLRPSVVIKKRKFVLATPEGDYHEMGLLLAHLMIRVHGYSSVYLGPHVPAQDIAETALRFNASRILIVSTVSKRAGAKKESLAFASEVLKKVGDSVEIILAGGQVAAVEGESSHIRIVRDFKSFDTYLES